MLERYARSSAHRVRHHSLQRARPRDSDAWRLARRPSPASSSPRVSCVPSPSYYLITTGGRLKTQSSPSGRSPGG